MKKALLEENFEVVKSYILNPTADETALNEEQKRLMDRWVSAGRILDKYPVKTDAVSLLMSKYPGISRAQAFHDVDMALRLFNSMHTFDYDFWHNWLLRDITKLMEECRLAGDRKNWAAAQRNLINAIGERPAEDVDPTIREKSMYYLVLPGTDPQKLELEKLRESPGKLSDFMKYLHKPIDDVEAEEMINS